MALSALNIKRLLDAADNYARLAKITQHTQVAFGELIESIVKEFEWIHRNFQWGPTPEADSSGGGGYISVTVPAQYLGRIEYQKDANLNPRGERLTYAALNRHERRYMMGFGRSAVVNYMVGVVDIESQQDQTTIRKLVTLTRTSGTGAISASQLMGFVVKFERMGAVGDAPRGKMYIQTDVYDRNSINAGGDIELTGSQSVYTSDESVLILGAKDFVSAYNTLTGGAGIKVHLSLDLWGS